MIIPYYTHTATLVDVIVAKFLRSSEMANTLPLVSFTGEGDEVTLVFQSLQPLDAATRFDTLLFPTLGVRFDQKKGYSIEHYQ